MIASFRWKPLCRPTRRGEKQCSALAFCRASRQDIHTYKLFACLQSRMAGGLLVLGENSNELMSFAAAAAAAAADYWRCHSPYVISLLDNLQVEQSPLLPFLFSPEFLSLSLSLSLSASSIERLHRVPLVALIPSGRSRSRTRSACPTSSAIHRASVPCCSACFTLAHLTSSHLTSLRLTRGVSTCSSMRPGSRKEGGKEGRKEGSKEVTWAGIRGT